MVHACIDFQWQVYGSGTPSVLVVNKVAHVHMHGYVGMYLVPPRSVEVMTTGFP